MKAGSIGNRTFVHTLAGKICKSNMCMFVYVQTCNDRRTAGCYQKGRGCHFKRALGQGNIVQNTMKVQDTKRNKI